jgi:hypothetical protein
MPKLKLCACGCGEPTPLAARNRTDRCQIKGKPVQYAPFHARKTRSGPHVSPGKKWCYACKDAKPLSQFAPSDRVKSGKKGICRPCNKIKSARWRETNRDYFRLKMRQFHLKKFGLTAANYETMLQKQNGLCAICAQPEKERRNGRLKLLAVDHSHKTGQVRGLLCGKCNQLLGICRENRDFLNRAILYLEKWHAD